MSIAVIKRALPQPVISRNQPLRHCPMRLRELVKCSSGNMASGSCSASTTWLKVDQVGHAAVAAHADDEDRRHDGQQCA